MLLFADLLQALKERSEEFTAENDADDNGESNEQHDEQDKLKCVGGCALFVHGFRNHNGQHVVAVAEGDIFGFGYVRSIAVEADKPVPETVYVELSLRCEVVTAKNACGEAR